MKNNLLSTLYGNPRIMDQTAEGVRTVIGPDWYGYIEMSKLEGLLKDIFGKEITVHVGSFPKCTTNIAFGGIL